MFRQKNYIRGVNVLEAAKKRIRFIIDTFGENCAVSFSGGKDSTVLLHLFAEIWREYFSKLPLFVHIDLEIIPIETIDIVNFYSKKYSCINYYLNESLPKTSFEVWQPNLEKYFMNRPAPAEVTEKTNFFTFIHKFPKLIFGNAPACMLVGLRCDEALNRQGAILQRKTEPSYIYHNEKANTYTASPLYDWHVSDIWKYLKEENVKYNALYDEFNELNVPLHLQRIDCLISDDFVKTRENMCLERYIEPIYERTGILYAPIIPIEERFSEKPKNIYNKNYSQSWI